MSGRGCDGRGRGSGGSSLAAPAADAGSSDLSTSAAAAAPSTSVEQPAAPSLGAVPPMYEAVEMTMAPRMSEGVDDAEELCFFFQVRRKADYVRLMREPTGEEFPKVAPHVLSHIASMSDLKAVPAFELASITELVLPLAFTLQDYGERGTLELWPERKLVDGKFVGVVDEWSGSRPADFLRSYEEAGFEKPRCGISEEHGRPRLLLCPSPGDYFEALQWAARVRLQVRFVSEPPIAVGHLTVAPAVKGKPYNPAVAKYLVEKELRAKYRDFRLLTSSAGDTQWVGKYCTTNLLTDADAFTRVMGGARVTFGVRAMGTSAAKTEQSATRAVTAACEAYVPDVDSLPLGEQLKSAMAESYKAAAVAMKAAAKTWGPMRLAVPTMEATAEAVVTAAPALSKEDLDDLAKAVSPSEMQTQLVKAVEKAVAVIEPDAIVPTWVQKAKAALGSLSQQLKEPAPPTPAESLQRAQVKRGVKVARKEPQQQTRAGAPKERQGRWCDVAAGGAASTRRRSTSRPRERAAQSAGKPTATSVKSPPPQQSKKARERQHNELRRGHLF